MSTNTMTGDPLVQVQPQVYNVNYNSSTPLSVYGSPAYVSPNVGSSAFTHPLLEIDSRHLIADSNEPNNYLLFKSDMSQYIAENTFGYNHDWPKLLYIKYPTQTVFFNFEMVKETNIARYLAYYQGNTYSLTVYKDKP